ncbi:hypothetical protein H0H93_014395 [Arthromyces matolae]|nr:hypothetical protein H0H93_014395 [Arthromyces matolae]
MHFLAILISLVSCGAFLATTAVPVTVPGTTVNPSLSSQDLGTSIIQTRDAKSSYGTFFPLIVSLMHGPHGVYLTDTSINLPDDEAHSESQIQPSDFLRVAWLVSITLDMYRDPKTGERRIPHAFDGDIKKAFVDKSETGPFNTISIIVLRDDRYLAAFDVLRQGLIMSGGSESLKVKGPDDQLEAELKRPRLPINYYLGSSKTYQGSTQDLSIL